MSKTLRILWPGLLAATLACSGACTKKSNVDVVSTYGKGIRIDGLEPEYRWDLPTGEAAERYLPQRADIRELIEGLIDERLVAAGFVAVDTNEDFQVRYRVDQRDKSDASVSTHGEVYKVGYLMLELIDPASGRFIWRALADARLDPTMPYEAREQRIQDALDAMFKEFPPRKNATN